MKPSTRIEEIEENLKKEYFPIGMDGNFTTAQLARVNARAIGMFLDEQAESQEPKALEEKRDERCCCGIDGVCKELGDAMRLIVESNWTVRVKCLELDNVVRKHFLMAKPQEEPKKVECICNQFCKDWPIHPMYTWERCICPCHQKETEPMDLKKKAGESVKVGVFAYKDYIILPRLKGKEIGWTIAAFNQWAKKYGYTPQISTDESFLNRWSQFIKSQE